MSKENIFNISYEVLAKAILVNYESFYVIDVESNAYAVYHESESYGSFNLTQSGDDFFESLKIEADGIIFFEDHSYVLEMLKKDNLLKSLSANKYYSFIYRVVRDDRNIYHQIRATLETFDSKQYIFLGVKDIDASYRGKKEDKREINIAQQKEVQYLNAILDTALAYMDINLSENRIIEKSSDHSRSTNKLMKSIPSSQEIPNYSDLQTWFCDNLVCENVKSYREVGNVENLLECFSRGERRVSVLFSVLSCFEEIIPCRGVFYLYQMQATGNIHCLFLLYDLTEQQIQSQLREKLETELKLSRMRNSASQMQPHFLYNALGSIQEVILTNPSYAASLLEDFTIHLRSCIRAMNNDDPISFSQELDNVRAYVNIEKMRFGDKLKIHYETKVLNFSVVPLTIQPIVENAIRHGIYERGKRGGTVTVRSTQTQNDWIIQVEDDGVGFDVDQFKNDLMHGKKDSTGLKNIEFRLEQMMHAKVAIKSEIGVGTTVTVTIPKGDL